MPSLAHKKTFAKKLLKLFGPDGDHWANGSLAYDKPRRKLRSDVNSVNPKSKQAQSWCLMGAMIKLGLTRLPEWELPEKHWLANEIRTHLRFQSIPGFNDKDSWRPIKSVLTQLAKTGSIKGAKLPKGYTRPAA